MKVRIKHILQEMNKEKLDKLFHEKLYGFLNRTFSSEFYYSSYSGKVVVDYKIDNIRFEDDNYISVSATILKSSEIVYSNGPIRLKDWLVSNGYLENPHFSSLNGDTPFDIETRSDIRDRMISFAEKWFKRKINVSVQMVVEK